MNSFSKKYLEVFKEIFRGTTIKEGSCIILEDKEEKQIEIIIYFYDRVHIVGKIIQTSHEEFHIDDIIHIKIIGA